MLLRNVRSQERAERLLAAAYASRRLSHAYLFAGPVGTGKLSSALALASAVICEDESGWCGECRHCTRIARFDHPDVRLTIPTTKSVSPEEIGQLMQTRAEDGVTPLRFPGNTYIGIDHIRRIEARLARKAFESSWRVEILIDVHRMNEQAANALLKSLEEPPSDTLFILSTSAIQWLLPTIRSRAHLVRFGRVSGGDIAGLLAERTGMEEEAAARIAASAEGSPGRALLMARDGEAPGREALELLKELRALTSDAEVVGLAAKTAKSQGRDGTMQIAAALRSLAHDLVRASEGAAPLYHLAGDLPDWRPSPAGASRELMATLSRAEKRLQRYVPPAMALLPPMLELRRVLGGRSDVE